MRLGSSSVRSGDAAHEVFQQLVEFIGQPVRNNRRKTISKHVLLAQLRDRMGAHRGVGREQEHDRGLALHATHEPPAQL